MKCCIVLDLSFDYVFYPPPVLKKRKGGIVMDLVRRLRRLRRPRRLRRLRRPRVTHLALYLPRYRSYGFAI